MNTKLIHLSNRGLEEETNTIPENNGKITFERKRDETYLPELDILKFWICIDVKICPLGNFFYNNNNNIKLVKLWQNISDQKRMNLIFTTFEWRTVP
jgi:hypothetical protein